MKRTMLAALLMAIVSGCGDRKADPEPVQQRKTVEKGPTREDRQAVLDGMLANANLPLDRAESYAKAHGLRIPAGAIDARRKWNAAHPGAERLSGGAEFIQSPIQPRRDK